MADVIVPRPGFRGDFISVKFIDFGDHKAEKIVVVNPDGTPIAGGGGGGTQYAEDTASAAAELLTMAGVVRKDVAGTLVDADGDRTELQVDSGGLLRVRVDAGGAGGGVVQQGAKDASAQPWQVETFVGVTAIDPRSIRALTAADVVTAQQGGAPWTADVTDRAARLVGVVYGDVGQLLQRAVTRDLQVQLRTGGAEYDARARTWTLASGTDSVTIAQPVAVTDNAGSLTVDAPVATPVAVRLSDGAAFIDPRDVSDRAARLVGVVYGSQGQQVQQTATNFNLKTEIHVGGTAIDPRSIRTLTSADVVSIGDGTDTATVLPVRTQPATTEKTLVVTELPNRLATYGCVTTTITPAITVGVKELLAVWHASGGTKDVYIVDITATGIVTTASTAGRSALRVSTITTAPTGGTELTKVDVSGAGASDMTNTMQVKTGGGAIGNTFVRKLTWFATQPVGQKEVSLFSASNPGNGLICRQGVNAGFSIDIEREVAHTALVDLWTVSVRWLEL